METYFAEIDENGVVLRVIVATQEFIDSGLVGDPANWVETTMDGSKKKNYAGKGDKYDKGRDAFIAPKPYDSWVLDEATARWKAPKDFPPDGKINKYKWDETTQDWVEKEK